MLASFRIFAARVRIICSGRPCCVFYSLVRLADTDFLSMVSRVSRVCDPLARGALGARLGRHACQVRCAGLHALGLQHVAQTVSETSWSGPSCHLILRRAYVESADRFKTIRSFDDPIDLLQFANEHPDTSTRALEVVLRRLGAMTNGSNYRRIVSDSRFHTLLSTISTRLEDCDAIVLSMIADGSARYRTTTSELSDFAQQLAEVVVKRVDGFNPRNLSTIALALAVRGVRTPVAIEFFRNEATKQIHDFEPSQCSMLLEAFRRWGVFDRELVDLLVERLSDEIDRFTSRDVIDTVAVLSKMSLARGFLLRRLCALAFENLHQFSPRETVRLFYSLAKLRFLAHSSVDEIIDVLTPEMHGLSPALLSDVVFSLGMTDSKHQVDVARTLVDLYLKDGDKTIASRVDFLWGLCALELLDEFKNEAKAMLEKVLMEQPPQNRVPLIKLFDVVRTVEIEQKKLKITIPPQWKAACDDADRYEMDRLESSRLHSEIVMRMDALRGSTRDLRWHLRMQRNVPCGQFRVDMLDEESKVVIDVELIAWPTSRRLKHRLLTSLGYKPLLMDYWDWRKARTEQEQNLFLEREVTRVLEG